MPGAHTKSHHSTESVSKRDTPDHVSFSDVFEGEQPCLRVAVPRLSEVPPFQQEILRSRSSVVVYVTQ